MNDTARFGFRFWVILVGVAVLVSDLYFWPIRNNRESPINTCVNNLRLIDGAEQMWALENNKTNSDMPTWAELQSYLGRAGYPLPKCPSGGTYTLGAISNRPTCSIPGHVLPSPGN
jgi:hypothetical protein